jgi:hypothetical protein
MHSGLRIGLSSNVKIDMADKNTALEYTMGKQVSRQIGHT